MKNNLKTGEIRGSRDRERGLTRLPLFWKYYIYFLRNSLLNVFFCLFIVFLFKKSNSFTRCSLPWKQMKDILREAVVENHDHVLSSYHYWRCMWLRLSVCGWVFVRIHQGVIWNYFLATKEHFDCLFFSLVLKKKKIALFHFGSSAPLPPDSLSISYLVLINLCSSGTNILLFIYSCCSMM